jgi:hypothetical protein
MISISNQVQTFIEDRLMEQGIISKDGLFGPICQTGEEYVELTIRGKGIVTLTIAAAGMVAGFGKAGATCYWRTQADYEDHHSHEEIFVRFCITRKKAQEKAA